MEYFGEEETFDKDGPPRYSVDLEPYNGDWNQSWFDEFIVARIPRLKSWPLDTAQLLIWKGGNESYLLKRVVKIKPFGPGMQYVSWAPTFEEGHLTPGAKIQIVGSGFGINRDTLIIHSLDLNKKWYIWPERWTENLIEAVAPEFDLDTLFDAQLIVRHQGTGRETNKKILIGPKMSDIWISGSGFAELLMPDPKDGGHIEFKDSHNFLLVTHDPGCGVQGNNGEDDFFAYPNKYVPNFKMNGNCFIAVDCFGWEDGLSYAVNMLSKCLSDPYLLGAELFVSAIAFLFDPETGKYTTELVRKPTTADPFTQVHWHNTCFDFSPYHGVQNKYLISFRLRGPEHLLPKVIAIDSRPPVKKR